MANNQRGNTKQAPKLVFNGNKFNHSKGYYQIPQELADIIFTTFAKQPAYIRLMLVLIGTEPGFGLAEQWVLERTGLNHASYNTTRNKLVEMGWLTCENGQVIVNFDTIYRRIESIPQKEEEALSSLCIESIPQISKNDTNSIESIPQMGGIQSIRQIGEEYSVNTSKTVSLNTPNDSVNTENSIESIPIIDKIDNSIDNLEYITMDNLSRIVGDITWFGEDVVKLPNGRMFRVKRTAQDWASIF